MNFNKERIAPLGLVLALLAALAAGGLYIVQQDFSLQVKISLALIPIGLALFALLDPERTRRMLTGRQARYGSNALVVTLAFLGLLIVVNYLVYDNNQRWDLTEDQQNTLAQETLETLSKLTENVHVQAFFTASYPTESADRLLDNYAQNSAGKFTYEFINPDTDPVTAQQAKITRDGSLSVRMGEKRELVDYASETELTNAMVRLMSGSVKQVYFLTGHGERDPNGTDEIAYNQLQTSLTDKNFAVSTLNLLAQPSVPEDADLIIIAGPTDPILEGEIELLRQYLDGGGKLIVLWEPSLLTNFGDSPDLMAAYLAESWGIQLGKNVIVDLVGQQIVQQPFMAVGTGYYNHPITNSLNQDGLATFFFTARSVVAVTDVEGITKNELVLTSADSWAETDLSALLAQQEPVFDEAADQLGPLPLVVVAENAATAARLMVVGDADFAANNSFTAYGNGDLIVNAIDWAVGQEDVIDLSARQTTTRSLTLTPTPYTMGLLFLISVILLPLLTLVLGGVAFIYRRRRG